MKVKYENCSDNLNINLIPQTIFNVRPHDCVCLCVRERSRERESDFLEEFCQELVPLGETFIYL